MLRYIKIFLQLVAVFLLAAVQLSLVSALPGPFFSINLLLVLLIFIVIFSDLSKFLFWSIYLGFLVDIFSFQAFGLFTIAFVLTALTVYFLQVTFLTNRSLYVFLALTAIGTLVFNFTWHIINLILGFFILKSGILFLLVGSFWQELFYQLLFHFLLTIIIFYIFTFTTRKFRPELLERK